MEAVIPKSGVYSVCCHPGWGSGVMVPGEALPSYAKDVGNCRPEKNFKMSDHKKFQQLKWPGCKETCRETARADDGSEEGNTFWDCVSGTFTVAECQVHCDNNPNCGAYVCHASRCAARHDRCHVHVMSCWSIHLAIWRLRASPLTWFCYHTDCAHKFYIRRDVCAFAQVRHRGQDAQTRDWRTT